MINCNSILRVVAGVLCLSALPGLASGTCAPGLASAQERLKAADAVFVGHIVKVRGPKWPPPYDMVEQGYDFPLEVEFEVRVAWKGVHESRVRTINNLLIEADLGGGPEYLVFAHRSKRDGWFDIMGCGNTKSTDKATQEIRELGAPEYVYQAGTS